jgi:hypothetical protein
MIVSFKAHLFFLMLQKILKMASVYIYMLYLLCTVFLQKLPKDKTVWSEAGYI